MVNNNNNDNDRDNSSEHDIDDEQDEDEHKYEPINRNSKSYKKHIFELDQYAKYLFSFCNNDEYAEYIEKINDFYDYFDKIMNRQEIFIVDNVIKLLQDILDTNIIQKEGSRSINFKFLPKINDNNEHIIKIQGFMILLKNIYIKEMIILLFQKYLSIEHIYIFSCINEK